MIAITPWLSLHCFLTDPRQQEAFLASRIVPLMREWTVAGAVESWFFIRYWEGGPHLRLRLRGQITADPAQVIASLGNGIATWMTPEPLRREDYYAAHGFDGTAVDIAALPWFAEGSIEAIAYVPELQRYGGAAAIAASEQLFAQSSAVAAALVRAAPGDMHRRTALAFALMAAAGFAFTGEAAGVSRYFDDYAAGWSQYSVANRTLAANLAADAAANPGHVAALRGLIADRGAGTGHPLTAAWSGGVTALVTALAALAAAGRLVSPYDGSTVAGAAATRRAIAGIIGSQIHMLNNRLGLAPAAELVLAVHIARAAAAIAAATPRPTLEMVA